MIGLKRIGEMARLMVGQPPYEAYLAHMRQHHPDRPPMGRVEFFRDREEARYGGRNGGKCC